MPHGGDPVRELGPYVVKGCVVLVSLAIVALIALGALIGSAL